MTRLAVPEPENHALHRAMRAPARPATRGGLPDACQQLFAAILIDDEVEPQVPPPATIQLDFTPDELAGCFDLALELWTRGFDRPAMIALSRRLLRAGDLDANDRQRLKEVRAKFKHLRYAHALYGNGHRSPPLLDRVTIGMGHIQDACRNGRPTVARAEGLLLRLSLAGGPAMLLTREAARLRPTTPAGFRALIADDVRVWEDLARSERVTGPAFHAARKRVGRQVSFWDTLRTLEPTPDRYRLSRALAAINGLMGDLHDRLVTSRGVDPASYRAAFPLPGAIRQRLAALTPRYRAALADAPDERG